MSPLKRKSGNHCKHFVPMARRRSQLCTAYRTTHLSCLKRSHVGKASKGPTYSKRTIRFEHVSNRHSSAGQPRGCLTQSALLPYSPFYTRRLFRGTVWPGSFENRTFTRRLLDGSLSAGMASQCLQGTRAPRRPLRGQCRMGTVRQQPQAAWH